MIRPNEQLTRALIAIAVLTAIVGCGSGSKHDVAPKSTSFANAAPPQSTSAAPQYIQTTSDFEAYVEKARSQLKAGSGGLGCFAIEKATSADDLDSNWWTQCMLDASAASSTLRKLAPQLSEAYTKTKAATYKTIADLDHWSNDCTSTDPDTQARRDCMVYLPRDIQLQVVEAAWHEDRNALGLGD
jgi:hypothetical protein